LIIFLKALKYLFFALISGNNGYSIFLISSYLILLILLSKYYLINYYSSIVENAPFFKGSYKNLFDNFAEMLEFIIISLWFSPVIPYYK